MRDDVELLAHLSALVAAEKAAAELPAWVTAERNGRKRMSLVCPLWIDGIVESGLRLELRGPQAIPHDRPVYGLIASLFATYRGRTWHLGRIEFDPENRFAPHRNPPGHSAPPIVQGPQFHPFAENAKRGLSSLSPLGNLPIAYPLDRKIVTFSAILVELRASFGIPGLWLEEPPWSPMLL